MEELVQEIPIYSLAESSTRGEHLFEMVQANGEFAKRRVTYLIPHRKDFYLFVLVRTGSSRHWVDTTPYVLKNNTFYVASPWQVHVKEKSTPLQGVLLSFTEEFLNLDESNTLRQLPIIQNRHNAHEIVLQPPDLAFIEDVLQKMWTEYQSNHPWRHTMLLSYLRILVVHTSRLYNAQFNSTPEASLLQQFKQLIDKHFMQLHQVADYAKLLHISAGYLSEIVKQQSGKTAIEHIHDRIVLEAKRQLFHTDLSAKEIAYDLGFEDAAYFNRFFKRLAEQTPAVFRTTTREMYH